MAWIDAGKNAQADASSRAQKASKALVSEYAFWVPRRVTESAA
jgi:hypothetical protein